MPDGGEMPSGAGVGPTAPVVPPAALTGDASPTVPDWQAFLTKAIQVLEPATRAETLVKSWFNPGSAAAPVAVKCADGNTYVIKGTNAGRQTVNDRIAAKLAALIKCRAVPAAILVAVSDELKSVNSQMAHIASGTAHGSRVMEECTDKLGIQHVDEGDNRTRFAQAAIFHGWIFPNDAQFIYAKADPHTVYSVDHGHCFHVGPPWTIQSLSSAPSAVADPTTVAACKLTSDELKLACQPLAAVSREQIAFAVGSVPESWGLLTMAERTALCEYLEKRRAEMVKLYVAQKSADGAKAS